MSYPSILLNNIPGIQYAFGDMKDAVPKILLDQPWTSTKPEWKQVHGIQITTIHNVRQICGETDGMMTAENHTPIGVMTADCVPILLAHRQGHAIASLHAGWRGTLAKITEAFVNHLHHHSYAPSDWVAVLGPSIGSCCYEVSPELITSFTSAFPDLPPEVIAPRLRMLDLKTILAQQLRRLGFHATETIPHCTYCSQLNGINLFHSYRRDGAKGLNLRQFSIISKLD